MLTKFAFQTPKPKPRAIAFGLFFHIVSIKSTLLLACLRIENIAQQIHYYVRANSLH